MFSLRQFVPQEACLKCVGCCRFSALNSVWSPCLLEEEALELVDKEGIPALSITIDKKILPIAHPDGEGFVCPMLDCKDNKCQIYAARPFECRLYPFLLALRDKKALLTVDLNCPYIQDKINTDEFKEYIQYLTDFLNSPQQLKIIKENPQIIQAYEDVLNVVELKNPDAAL